jgi:aquaporin related protein
MASVVFPGRLNTGKILHPNVSLAQGFLVEMQLTAQFVFTIFTLAVEKNEATFIVPNGIRLSLFIAEMIGEPL